MESLMRDLRFALRSLRKHAGISAIAILSLGLGIGGATTVFTWLDAFVVEPLPAVPRFGRLVAVNTAGPGGAEWSVSYPSLRDWRAGLTSMDLAASNFVQLGLRGEGGGTERAWGMLASGNYFDVLRVGPALGRLLTLDDEERYAPVAVLGWAYWQRRFAGDSAIVGRHLTLNGVDVTVVGVAPPRFGGTIIGLQFDVFLPVTLQPLVTGVNSLDRRQSQWLDGLGRLRDGFSMAQARAELDALAKRIGEATGDSDARYGALVQPLTSQGAPAVMKPVFLALLGLTGVVLLIACANVANLLLARAVARRREIGIRLALGADRRRLVRQLLTESLALGLLAGLVGILAAFWGRDLLLLVIPPAPFPIGIDIALSTRVLVFAAAVTLATTLVFGLVPAIHASRPDLVPALKDEIGEGPAHRSRLQSGLVVAQVALSLVALVCAGLFGRSLSAARAADVGFSDPERVLLASTDLRLAGLPDSGYAALIGGLIERVRALPGVEAASVASLVPLGFGGNSSRSIVVEGYEPQPDENMSISYSMAGPDYFRAMGIRLVRGRGFADADGPGAPRVAVVNERMAERFWPGTDPVGRRIRAGGEWRTVVGVAAQGRYQQITEPPRTLVYYPILQEPSPRFTIHVRAAGDAPALTAAVRRAVAEAGADIPFLDVRTMAQHMQASMFTQKLGAGMLAAFGVMALAMAAVGIYGVMAYRVSQRTREIGVRVALGAARGDVVGMVVGRAMRLTGIGLLIGLAASLGAAQLLRTLLVGVGPRDPVTFGVIAAVLAAVALAASWIPARRAARVDPLVALRSE